MRDRLPVAFPAQIGPAVRVEPLERRPIGTNGYVSTWGAIMSVCPPKGC